MSRIEGKLVRQAAKKLGDLFVEKIRDTERYAALGVLNFVQSRVIPAGNQLAEAVQERIEKDGPMVGEAAARAINATGEIVRGAIEELPKIINDLSQGDHPLRGTPLWDEHKHTTRRNGSNVVDANPNK